MNAERNRDSIFDLSHLTTVQNRRAYNPRSPVQSTSRPVDAIRLWEKRASDAATNILLPN